MPTRIIPKDKVIFSDAQRVVQAFKNLIDIWGGVTWLAQEQSGMVAEIYSAAVAKGRDIVLNGGYATDTLWTKGTGWTITGGVAVATAAALNANLSQAMLIALGRSYEVIYTIVGFTAGSIRVQVGSSGNGTVQSADGTYTETIVCAGSTTLIFNPQTAFSGNIDNVSVKELNIPASSPSLVGTITGVTVGQPGLPGALAWSYDGVTDLVNIHSTMLNSIFTPTGYTFHIPIRVPLASIWSDATIRRILAWESDSSNRWIIRKTATTGQIEVTAIIGGVTKTVNINSNTTLNFQLLTITYDLTNDQYKVYLNGIQTGSTQTSIGTWTGNLASDKVLIGATDTAGAQSFSGLIEGLVFLPVVMTAADIAKFSRDIGVKAA